MEPVVIQPSRGWSRLEAGELWAFRELFYFLVWRDVKVRYKQTLFGATWAVLQPFVIMVVFSIFLGRLAHVPSSGLPYPIFAYAGLVPWTLFASSMSGASTSLVSNTNLVTKVYFPRLILPMAAAGSYLLDFAIALFILFLLMLRYHIRPTVAVVWLPAFTLLAVIASLAVGIFMSAVNVRYRDIQYTVPFLLQVLLFVSPVAYPASLVPKAWRVVYGLNPMAGVVEGFRWAILGSGPAPSVVTAASASISVALLVGAILYFKRVERSFADVI
jgi:homopolymeric O-antigen transport system permease protein